MKKSTISYEAVAIGCSAGGTDALQQLLPKLPATFPLAILVVQHLHPQSSGYLVQALDKSSQITVKEAQDKELIVAGVAYFAPPNYHLLVERDRTLAMNVDEPVNFSRPSIDVLFETAALTFEQYLIGIVLTGANQDGKMGLKCVKAWGGLTIVQDPEEAEVPTMPQEAIQTGMVDHILSLEEIAAFLLNLQ